MDAWIFGYGSLVWRPDMPVLERVPARLPGFARRFWQGSPDHRGTPQAPGRVVTLIDDPHGAVDGVLYRVERTVADEVLAKLDHREKAGYQRLSRSIEVPRGNVQGLVYYAAEGNPSWLGPAPLQVMASHIATSVGPSGSNRAYLLRLDEALRSMAVVDEHVAQLAEAVRALAR